MVSFTLEFDKPDKKYQAGETIYCIVKISVSSSFKARSLSILFKGIAHTSYSEYSHHEQRYNHNNGTCESVPVYRRHDINDETLKDLQYLIGSQNSSADLITPGTYTYNVMCELPDDLPSSIKHRHGYIKYSAKVNYDVVGWFDKRKIVNFHVDFKSDLNKYPDLLSLVRKERENVFGCCCCESAPLLLNSTLPRSGYVPGETIPITIDVDNQSNVAIKSIRVKLKERITFCGRENDEKKTLHKFTIKTGVAPNERKQFQESVYLNPNFNFKKGCIAVNCYYDLIIEAVASGCHFNPNVKTEITIGTIPFNNTDPRPALNQPINDEHVASRAAAYDIASNSRNLSTIMPSFASSFEESQRNLIDLFTDQNTVQEAENSNTPPE